MLLRIYSPFNPTLVQFKPKYKRFKRINFVFQSYLSPIQTSYQFYLIGIHSTFQSYLSPIQTEDFADFVLIDAFFQSYLSPIQTISVVSFRV